MQTSTTKFCSQTNVDMSFSCIQRLSRAVSGMLTVMTTVLNLAQITPCQFGEELSVTQVQTVPRPHDDTDNWHIRHLPPKCLAHAEKFTQLAGGPSSVPSVLGGEDQSIQAMQLSPGDHELPQLKVPCNDCEIP